MARFGFLVMALALAGAALAASATIESVFQTAPSPESVDRDSSVLSPGMQCTNGTDGNATCSFEYPHRGGPQEESEMKGYQSPSMADKWAYFVIDLGQYASEVRAYLEDLAKHASSWADLALKWSHFTKNKHPYSSPLHSFRHQVDKYTDDVSAYAAALSSFASGFAVAAEESISSENGVDELASFSKSLGGQSTGWESANDLLTRVTQVSSSMDYLSTYATDLSRYSGAWLDNVKFLNKRSNLTAEEAAVIVDDALYLKGYAYDMAAFAADWAQHANGMDKWTAEWVQYGSTYGVRSS